MQCWLPRLRADDADGRPNLAVIDKAVIEIHAAATGLRENGDREMHI